MELPIELQETLITARQTSPSKAKPDLLNN
jgi:hypothetical protein